MSEPIERLRFYERQYLRSHDWTAEQEYHIEMRRRLNRALHLWGIVEGLEILTGELVPGAGDQFYVSAGMAIDGFGRELFLAAPRELSADDFAQGQFQGKGTYSVWAGYRRSSETPASSGYRVCDAKDQLTRWQESIEIFVSNKLPATVPPTAAEAPPDDPETEWPILLGALEVTGDSSTGPTIVAVATTAPSGREYIGLRAQHLTSPAAKLDPANPDKMLPILVETDLREQQNLLIGQPVIVTETSKILPALTDEEKKNGFPGAQGNLFCEKNIFVGGDIFRARGDEWLRLGELIRQSLPEVQFGRVEVQIESPSVNDQALGTKIEIKVTCKSLKQASFAEPAAWVSGVKWNTKAEVKDIVDKIPDIETQLAYGVTYAVAPVGPSASYNLTLTCAVASTLKFEAEAGPPQVFEFKSPIVSLTVQYAVILYP